jgi:hypothetical protein
MELSRAITVSFKEYQQCEQELKLGGFSEGDCLEDWEAYQKCSGEVELLKQSLAELFLKKEAVRKDIEGLLNN